MRAPQSTSAVFTWQIPKTPARCPTMRRTPSFLAALALAGGAALTGAADCNGHAELCNRRYSNVTFVGSHDSAFVGILPSDNQLTSVPEQLDQGVRFLTTQVHPRDGAIECCHTSCDLLDAGPLADYLADVKDWLDADGHENEVVTLLIVDSFSDDVTPFGDVFADVGLDAYAYAPPDDLALDDWPTLGSLIDMDKRLVVFMGKQASAALLCSFLLSVSLSLSLVHPYVASSSR